MANGTSPVPKMPTDVFTRLTGWQLFEGGVREDSNSPVYYLRVVSDGPGEVKWDLASSVGWDGTYAQMRLSGEDGAILQDCDLDVDGFTLTDSSSNEYNLHSNDGTPAAYLAAL